MKKSRGLVLWLFVTALVFAAGMTCQSNPVDPNKCKDGNCGGENNNAWKVDDSWVPKSECGSADADALPASNVVAITYNNGGAPTVEYSSFAVENDIDMITPDITGEHVILRSTLNSMEINVILSGTAKDGSLKIYGRSKVSIYMSGVNITNPKGPAINIQNGSRIGTVTVHLLGGCERKNFLTDGKPYDMSLIPAGESAKGLFFAEPNVVFTGGGTLELRSKHNHAIVVDNSINITSGNIIIHESANDGIHANHKIDILGGNVQIKSVGDAIQSEKSAADGFNEITAVSVTGGKIAARTTGIKSHGIASERDIIIGGNANISITVTGAGSKGIRTKDQLTISGGAINVQTAGGLAISQPGGGDDAGDTSSAAGIKAFNFQMTGGEYKALSAGNNSKGINIDNNAAIQGGSIDIRAHGHGLKVDGELAISGGAIRTESAAKKGIDCKNTNISPNASVESIDGKGAGGY